jgi:hypothetical protein
LIGEIIAVNGKNPQVLWELMKIETKDKLENNELEELLVHLSSFKGKEEIRKILS